MSVFTLAICYMTTSNLPWFINLTFQVPMQYCSLQHWTLLPSLVISTTGHCFHFGSISSFFLEFFSPLISSSIFGTYWPEEFIFFALSFCLFILFLVFWKQESWSILPLPSKCSDHILSELSTMTCPSWVALHGMAHSFIELDKAVVHVISLGSFLWLWFSLCALWWIRTRGVCKLPDGWDCWVIVSL